jgi:hypothetical protein
MAVCMERAEWTPDETTHRLASCTRVTEYCWHSRVVHHAGCDYAPLHICKRPAVPHLLDGSVKQTRQHGCNDGSANTDCLQPSIRQSSLGLRLSHLCRAEHRRVSLRLQPGL